MSSIDKTSSANSPKPAQNDSGDEGEQLNKFPEYDNLDSDSDDSDLEIESVVELPDKFSRGVMNSVFQEKGSNVFLKKLKSAKYIVIACVRKIKSVFQSDPVKAVVQGVIKEIKKGTVLRGGEETKFNIIKKFVNKELKEKNINMQKYLGKRDASLCKSLKKKVSKPSEETTNDYETPREISDKPGIGKSIIQLYALLKIAERRENAADSINKVVDEIRTKIKNNPDQENKSNISIKELKRDLKKAEGLSKKTEYLTANEIKAIDDLKDKYPSNDR